MAKTTSILAPNFPKVKHAGESDSLRGRSRALYLAPTPEQLPLSEHLQQAMDNSLLWFTRKGAKGEYAESEFMFLRLAKSHPDLCDVEDGFEAADLIEDAIGCTLEEFGIGRNTYATAGKDGAEHTPLRQQIWSSWPDIRPAVLAPTDGDLMRQAWTLMERQPVCSGICPSGDDPLHQLLGVAFWLSQLTGGKPFGLEQNLLSKLLGVSQRYVSTLIRTARQQGHLELAETGPQDPAQARREKKVMEYVWLTPLSSAAGPKL